MPTLLEWSDLRSTSREALTEQELSGRAESHREMCLQLVKRFPGLTAVELHAKQTAMSRHEISRRLPELRTLGLVANGEKRMCSINGNRQGTWVLNSEGE